MAATLTPASLNLVQSSFIDATGYFICVDATPTFLYDKENRIYTDKRNGTKLEVVIPQQKYERIVIQLPVGFDDIAPNTKLRFEGLSAHFYRDFATGEYFISAKAEKAIVVK